MHCYLGVARDEILASTLRQISVDQWTRGYADYDDPDLAGELAPSVQRLGQLEMHATGPPAGQQMLLPGQCSLG